MHLRLHRQDKLEQLVLWVWHVRSLAVPLIDHGPRYHAARVDLPACWIWVVQRETRGGVRRVDGFGLIVFALVLVIVFCVFRYTWLLFPWFMFFYRHFC